MRAAGDGGNGDERCVEPDSAASGLAFLVKAQNVLPRDELVPDDPVERAARHFAFPLGLVTRGNEQAATLRPALHTLDKVIQPGGAKGNLRQMQHILTGQRERRCKAKEREEAH